MKEEWSTMAVNFHRIHAGVGSGRMHDREHHLIQSFSDEGIAYHPKMDRVTGQFVYGEAAPGLKNLCGNLDGPPAAEADDSDASLPNGGRDRADGVSRNESMTFLDQLRAFFPALFFRTPFHVWSQNISW